MRWIEATAAAWADRRGVSTIEFAFIAPTFFLLLAAVVELGYLAMGDMALESGSRAAARYGLTGAAIDGETREQTVRRLIIERICPAEVDESRNACLWAADKQKEYEDGSFSPLFLTARAYRDVGNLGRAEPFVDDAPENGKHDPGEKFTDVNGNEIWDADMGAAGPGGSGDVVVYEAGYYQNVLNPLLRAALGADVFHQTRMVIRNEPF